MNWWTLAERAADIYWQDVPDIRPASHRTGVSAMDRLAAIEIFIRVVDTGSFSAAARHFDIGQPAASKAVAQLEEWLGVKLLLRSTRKLPPICTGIAPSSTRAMSAAARSGRFAGTRRSCPCGCRAA